MLRTIGFASLLVALLVVICTSGVQAQSVSMSAAANVMSALTITAPASIDFGNVPASRTAVLDPKNAANSFVGSMATVGRITITGANSTDLLVTFPSTITLSDGTPADNLTLTLSVTGDASSANQAGSSALSTGATVTTSGSGNYSMWVGGSLPTGTNTNTFAGSATFAVEYK